MERADRVDCRPTPDDDAPEVEGAVRTETAQPATYGSLLCVAIVVLVLGAAVVSARGLNEAARQLPLVVGIPTLVLALVVLVREFIRLRQTAPAGDRKRADPARAAGTEDGMSESKVFIVFAALVVTYLFLGFPWGAAVFLFCFLLIVGKTTVIKSLLITVGVILPVHLVFVVLLRIPQFAGWLL